MIETIAIGYIFLVNGALFVLMGWDKQKARHQQWRIPEKTLLLLGLAGGGAAGLAAMRLFRHKTKHPSFYFFFLVGSAVAVGLLYVVMSSPGSSSV